MNVNSSHYYDLVKKLSSLTGQWPYQRPITRLICVILMTLSTMSMIIPQIAKFFTCQGNLQCIFHTMSSYILTTITLVKLYTCYFNRCKMKVLIDQLFVDWNELETPEEYEIMKRYAKNGRRYSLGYSLYYYFGVYVFISMSLIPQMLDVVLPLNESRPILPTYPGYYFVDERKYFFYIFSHSIMAWEIAVTVIVTHDCMLLTYIEHVCSIFALVGFRFERLIYNDAMKVLHSHISDAYRKRIAFSVYTHRKALKFAQLIGDTFSLTLTIQLALNTIMISITLLQVTQRKASILEMIRYVMYVVGQLIHIFFLSFEGQKLIDHSLQTRDKIYNSLWYETPTKSQRMLMFVMQKSLQPIFLSASKIFIFSMENFTMVVQTSMSYFTVLSKFEISYLNKVGDERLFVIKTMNANSSHYYGVVKKLSSVSGQWPYQRPITRLICVILMTLSTISMIIPQIAKFVTCGGNLQCIFETMTSYMLTTVSLVKLYTCYFNRCKMKILIDQLFVDWNELETPEEYEIMKRYAMNGRRYSLGYSLYCYFAVYVFMSVSLIPQVLDIVLPLNESRPILPTYPGYYFVDERKYFFYIFSHAIMAWEIAMTGIVTHDCILLTYIEHVCSIFALVGFRFERLMYLSKRNNNDPVNISHSYASDTYRKRIAFSVYTHRKALKFAQLIEDTFSLTLGIQIVINTIMISITLLQITQQDAGILEVIRYAMYVIGQLIHLFCLSFEGQKLIDHSLQTRDKIYNSLWYETPTKSQRMLLFVMQKSLQPIFLSAGKIYIFSMENFTMIVQTSMSYFTVLSSLD
ncbi:uncharacterized protein [Temnothorax longispinosus]|uniref:uncharacterized protein n=1 Tax=Temnothorax longispinosus TaxID=300112 RepID=UPI003A997EEE